MPLTKFVVCNRQARNNEAYSLWSKWKFPIDLSLKLEFYASPFAGNINLFYDKIVLVPVFFFNCYLCIFFNAIIWNINVG